MASSTIDPAAIATALDDLATAIESRQTLTGDDRLWLEPFEQATAIRAAMVCDLLNMPQLPAVTSALSSSHVTASDPAEQLTNREALRLNPAPDIRRSGYRRGTSFVIA